ncbi:uncharacterized protein LOC143054081 isoform X2 [Mytilus galloprovincialis]|uniref:uncharacterized protein LOC143054081 isoform X2 n=1 Tax=Mytilus galloprovincialis TaxID=29158 RepID=UPI003F7CA4BD
MSSEKFLHASDQAASYLASQVGPDGVLLDQNTDGDFVSFPEKSGRERKSSSFPMSHFWIYMNNWIAMGAHRSGRFDISVPAYNFSKSFYNTELKAVCVTEKFTEITEESTMDCLSTSHFGLLSLYMGDINTAKECGETLLYFIKAQPNIEKELLLRMSAKTGSLLTANPDNMEPFYKIKKDSPNQLYFFLGYHSIFMTKLYQATQDTRFLASAVQILDFALTCHESIFSFSFSHKVAYAAALVATETKDDKYKQMAIRICEFLLSIQTDNGLFDKDFEPVDKYDQSAEIAIWLRETASELSKIN